MRKNDSMAWKREKTEREDWSLGFFSAVRFAQEQATPLSQTRHEKCKKIFVYHNVGVSMKYALV